MNWRVGDDIAIASTGHRHSQIENEQRTIKEISPGYNEIYVKTNFLYFAIIILLFRRYDFDVR